MPFWRNYYHLVWATKERKPLITADVEPVLKRYLRLKSAELKIGVYALDGWTDHLHMVVTVPPKLAISDAVKNLKGASAHYLNTKSHVGEKFVWQRGYGVLTVSQKSLAVAISYVQKQKEHHQNNTDNSWLERVDPGDDGPTVTLYPDQNIVREDQSPYITDDPFPF